MFCVEVRRDPEPTIVISHVNEDQQFYDLDGEKMDSLPPGRIYNRAPYPTHRPGLLPLASCLSNAKRSGKHIFWMVLEL